MSLPTRMRFDVVDVKCWITDREYVVTLRHRRFPDAPEVVLHVDEATADRFQTIQNTGDLAVLELKEFS